MSITPEILLAQRKVPDDTCAFLSGLPSYKTLALTPQENGIKQQAVGGSTQLPAPSPAAPGPAPPSTAQTVRSSPKQTGAQTPAAERGTGALLKPAITTAGVRAAETPTLVQPKICT